MLVEPNKKFHVVQSNTLITASYRMKVNQLKMVYMAISFVKQNDTEFKKMRVKVKDIINLFGLKSGKNMYSRVRNELIDMKSHVIQVDHDSGYDLLSWFDKIRYNEDDSSIEFTISEDLKPYLLKIDGNFTSQMVERIMNFHSFYTIRIYGFLKEYEGFKEKRIISIDDLKKMLLMPKERYSVYGEFRRNVILPAQKELRKKNDKGEFISDIRFDFLGIKTGRKITDIEFTIISNENQKLPKPKKPNETLGILLNYKIDQEKAIKATEEFPSEELIECISILENKLKRDGKIENPGGYLLKLINSGAGKNSIEQKKENTDSTNTSKGNEEIGLQDREKEAYLLSRRFKKERIEEFLEKSSDEEKEQYLQEILKKFEGKQFQTNLIESTGFNDRIAQNELVKLIPNYEVDREAYITSKLSTL